MAGLHDHRLLTAVVGCLKVFNIAPEFVSGL